MHNVQPYNTTISSSLNIKEIEMRNTFFTHIDDDLLTQGARHEG